MSKEEKKNRLSEQVEAEANTPPSAAPEKDTSKKRFGMGKMALLCAVVFIVLYAIVNSSAFSGLFSALLSVLSPIILGFAFAYMLNPILKLYEFKIFKRLKRKNLLRVLSLLMTYITAALIIALFLLLIIPQLIQSIMEFVGKFDGYVTQTTNIINSFIRRFVGEHNLEDVINEETVISTITNLISSSGDLMGDVMNYVIQYGTGLVVGVKNLVLAIFISIYVLSSKERLKAQVNKLTTALFSQKGKRRFYRYVKLCDRTFGGFFIGKIIDSLIIGAITLVTLLICRMPYALLVSTIVCITNVIPFFGPIFGAIPSFFIIFIVSPGKALLFLLLILIIQQLDGNVIGPKILGDTTGISSLGVIVSIIIMGDLFGVVGMIIGVPLFALIVALGKELLEHRLKKKELPTDTAEYYAADSLVDPHEVHESVSLKLFNNIGHFFLKLARPLRGRKRKTDEKDSRGNKKK